jgi:DNA recombination protein RmuC
LTALKNQHTELRDETNSLVSALKHSGTRGTWGEIQLKRAVELAGMVPYCDFEEQVHTSGGGHDHATRPDLVVRLPGGTSIAVDAKAPGDAFFKANETEVARESDQLLEQFATTVADHVKKLSAKAYWDRVQPAPDFVVMYLPIEPMLAAALTKKPSLLEDAFKRNVHLATPTSLISILRAAAFGWRQEKLAEDTQKVARLSDEMVKRVIKMWDSFDNVGRRLNSAVDAFNDTVGTFEHRVRPSAKRLDELVGNVKDLKEIEPIAKRARALSAASTASEDSEQ